MAERGRPWGGAGYQRETVAANARRFSARQGLTRADLSLLTGLSEYRVGLLLRGRADWRLRDLHLVARALDVEAVELLRPTTRQW